MRTPTTRTLAIALAAVTVALAPAAPTAALPATASTPGSAASPALQDLRSPDARDAAEGYAPTPGQDLRSPDARDAAEGYGPTLAAPSPVPGAAPSDGFDWISAAIGVGAVNGLLLVLLAAVWARRLPGRRGAGPRKDAVLGA